MKTNILNYLYKDKTRHAYVIKAVENNTRDFELRKIMDQGWSYAAIWHEDSIVTLYGDLDWCREMFNQYLGHYNYYDMAPSLMSDLYKEMDEKFKDRYELESHSLMKLNKEALLKITNNGDVLDDKSKVVKKVKSIDNTSRYQFLERDGRILGSVMVETVAGSVFVISEMIIKKQFRRKGMAYKFIVMLLNQIKMESNTTDEIEFILYVDQDNTPAVKLYEKLRFENVSTYQNLVLMD